MKPGTVSQYWEIAPQVLSRNGAWFEEGRGHSEGKQSTQECHEITPSRLVHAERLAAQCQPDFSDHIASF
jgi:hypothetical protein